MHDLIVLLTWVFDLKYDTFTSSLLERYTSFENHFECGIRWDLQKIVKSVLKHNPWQVMYSIAIIINPSGTLAVTLSTRRSLCDNPLIQLQPALFDKISTTSRSNILNNNGGRSNVMPGPLVYANRCSGRCFYQ